jgi:hypothetical protein
LRNEYLAAENKILRAQIKGRILLSHADKKTLADIGYQLGRNALRDIANVAKPDTILGWYRKLVARKFDGSNLRRYPGRPRIDPELEALVVQIANENPSWGYDRIVGALANLNHTLSDETVGNILQRNGIPPAPQRKLTTTWRDFIRAHRAVLAGTDFFTVEVLTLRGLVTYYVLFFIYHESRRIEVAGITPHPNARWMEQMARNVTMDDWGFLNNCHYLIHDRDTKFCRSFRTIIQSGLVEPIKLPARSPNLNAHAERWVRSVKEEALSKLILFGEASLRRVLGEYVTHFHHERNHQGKGNVLLFPSKQAATSCQTQPVHCQERLGGLLKYYYRQAA